MTFPQKTYTSYIETEYILSTKLQAPPQRPNTLARQTLLHTLQEGSYRPLTILHAPAGFGKTTLAASWYHQWKGLTFWLTLDSEEDELTTFYKHLLAAFRATIPDFGSMLQQVLESTPQRRPGHVQRLFINALQEIPAQPPRD